MARTRFTKASVVTSYLSGTGNYTVPSPAPTFIRAKVIGAGGGGTGGGGGSNGTNGTATTFGSSLLTANGGAAAAGVSGGAGGTFTVSAPAIDVGSTPGTRGGPGNSVNITAANARIQGGYGGSTRFGGLSAAGNPSDTGVGDSGAANSGCGGAGGGSPAAGGGVQAGGGGGSGAQIEALIPAPVAGTTYAYSIGVGGNAGLAGSFNGGAGGSGIIVIEEVYG